MRHTLFAFLLYCFHLNVFAAVILQYHHVSETTPSSTSISPKQFEVHMQYLKDHQFNVVPLSFIMNAIKKQQAISDKTVAITFDDAYIDILENGAPILEKYNYPYTLFINPNVIKRESNSYLTWAQLKTMADNGVIIANHGLNHNSMARKPKEMTEEQWRSHFTQQLLTAEKIIEENIGQSWRYFAYPYGEYTSADLKWIKENNFIAFTQQSGAVGLATNLAIVPRFPASQPYDKISGLRDKLNSLPFSIALDNYNAKTIFKYKEAESITFDVITDDFNQSQLNCYISGLGKQKIHWNDDNSFTINFNEPLPIGRVRCNCTAPSIEKPGRYYWYSKPWFILKANGDWYHL